MRRRRGVMTLGGAAVLSAVVIATWAFVAETEDSGSPARERTANVVPATTITTAKNVTSSPTTALPVFPLTTVAPSAPTTTATLAGPSAERREATLGPGAWTVAARLAETLSQGDLDAIATAVAGWFGVLDVALISPTAEGWARLTGLQTCVDREDERAAHFACGPGIVVLGGDAQRVARQLETAYEAITLISAEAAWGIVNEYVDSALSANPHLEDIASPEHLESVIEPGDLVAEQHLILEDVFRPEEPAAVTHVAIQVGTPSSPLRARFSIEELPQGSERFGSTEYEGMPVVGMEVGIPRGGTEGSAGLVGWLDGPGLLLEATHQNAYAVGGLLPDVAIVTFELQDGSIVWQRPLAGMVLFIDSSCGSECRLSSVSLVAYGADGKALMRTTGGADEPFEVTTG